MAYREAVLVIHGMGEQRPLDTLERLAEAMLATTGGEHANLVSRPTDIGESYEARRYIVRPRFPGRGSDDGADDGQPFRPQRDLFEYHWSPKMTGNRLDDLLTTTRRILLSRPSTVPGGILGVWLVMWAAVIALGAVLLAGARYGVDVGSLPTRLLAAIPGWALLSPLVAWAVTKALPKAVTASFVDVVRYLDDSPRSYDVRRDVRAGAVQILRELNAEYDRVTVVAHSLGSYIAYDAIRHLWGELGDSYKRDAKHAPTAARTARVEAALAALARASTATPTGEAPTEQRVWTEHERCQRALYEVLREDGLDWRITDLITFGSPMYMADRIYTGDEATFRKRVRRLEFPTCPPAPDNPDWSADEEQRATGTDGTDAALADRWSFVRRSDGRRVLHQGAPFAPTRWMNFWFPTKALFFGDWFGGPLGPLFGPGIVDVPITSGGGYRLLPALAHARYLEAIAGHPQDEVSRLFHAALFAHRPRPGGGPGAGPGGGS